MTRPFLSFVLVASLVAACGSASDDAPSSGGSGGAGSPGGGAAGTAASGAGGQVAGGTGGAAGTGGATAGGAGASGASMMVGGDRPTPLQVPPSYDGATAMPLVMMLHGYSASGAIEDAYIRLSVQAEALGFFYLRPDGFTDSTGKKYWNATAACCDFDGTKVDDEAYLVGLVEEVQAKFKIDPKRIYLFGHSNGGFMSYRLACNHADKFSAIAVLAGAMNIDPAACKPSKPVSLLHIHGTSDETISYVGGSIGISKYPSAETSIADWLSIDGCDAAGDASAAPLDLDTSLAGPETLVTKYVAGCKAPSAVEHWKIVGGGHIPKVSQTFAPSVAAWLLAH